MSSEIDHEQLDDALRRCGATWDAAQAHGVLAGRLATDGAAIKPVWLATMLEGTDESNALCTECADMLTTLFASTYRQFTERQSEFALLLPDDSDTAHRRTEALAHWCEGFLHGLVSGDHGDALKSRLGAEPVADIIKDMLQITRATVGDDDEDEDSEEAYTEIVEYVRVAAQMVYEELADLRPERLH